METKAKKKHGFLITFLIIIAVFIAIVIFSVVAVMKIAKIYGLTIDKFNSYLNMLNKQVNEERLVENPITKEDLISFKTKAQSVNFTILNNEEKVDFNKIEYAIADDLCLTGNEIAAMLNEGFKSNNDYNDVEILQFDILKSVRNNPYIKSIVKYDLTTLKKKIGNIASGFPNYIYLTVATEYEIDGTAFFAFGGIYDIVLINQLDDKSNKEILDLLKTILNEEQVKTSVKNFNNGFIFDQIREIASIIGSEIVLENNESLTFKKLLK